MIIYIQNGWPKLRKLLNVEETKLRNDSSDGCGKNRNTNNTEKYKNKRHYCQVQCKISNYNRDLLSTLGRV
jgi:hypothetical protein